MKDNDDNFIRLNDYKKQKLAEDAINFLTEEIIKQKEHDDNAPIAFLSAWKKGVALVGSEFFVIKSDKIAKAADKWELAPNLDVIQSAINGKSHGEQVFLGLLYSFYDSIEGQKLLEKFSAPNLVDALAVLDLDQRAIIAELWLNYTGW